MENTGAAKLQRFSIAERLDNVFSKCWKANLIARKNYYCIKVIRSIKYQIQSNWQRNCGAKILQFTWTNEQILSMHNTEHIPVHHMGREYAIQCLKYLTQFMTQFHSYAHTRKSYALSAQFQRIRKNTYNNFHT